MHRMVLILGLWLVTILLVFVFLEGMARADGSPPPTSLGGWAALFAWAALTGIVNEVTRAATPADVDAWAEKNPRIAQLAAILRRLGVEPVALLQAIYGFILGKIPASGHAAPPPVANPYREPARDAVPPPPPPAGFIELPALLLVVVLGGALWGLYGGGASVVLTLTIGGALMLSGCGLLWATAPAATSLALCIVDQVHQHPGRSFEEYAAISVAHCGADALSILEEVLKSEDPALADLKPGAKAIKEGGAAHIEAYVERTHARVAAIRAAEAHP